jgi:hypothetical protein
MSTDASSPLLQKWITAGVAIAGFAVFVAAVAGFRSVSRPDAVDLGISAWLERPATESRLKPIVDGLLKQSGLGSAMAQAVAPAWLKAADSPKIWEAMNGAAEVLVDTESKARLTAVWADTLRRDAAYAAGLRELRAYRTSPDSKATVIETISQEYARALVAAEASWLASELPAPVIDGLLLKNSLDIQAVKATKTQAARTRAERLDEFARGIRTAALNGIQPTTVDAALRRAIGADLDLWSAQEAVVKAIDGDFSARWMWTLTAAIFLTLAVSAIAGSAWRTWQLSAPGARAWPIVCYLVAVSAGLAYGLTMRARLPDFLARPVNSFASLYGIHFDTTMLLINTITATAVTTLFVTAWTSFLITSRDDQSDEHLETRLATLRWTFHTATIVLVAAVLHLFAFLQWPSAFLPEASAAVVQSGAKVAALALGAVFSTILLLIYLPASSVLIGEARARKEANASDTDRVARLDRMLEQNGFSGPQTQQVLRFVQLFAPLLIAPLGEQIVTFLGP